MRSYLPLALILVCLLVLGSGLSAVAPPTSASPRSTAPGLAPNHSAPATVTGTVHPPPSASSSGRGAFFLNYPQPTAPATNLSCRYQPPYYTAACTNDTGNPSITVTPSGGVVTAYTAFASANPCSGAANLTATVVGIDVSANGSVWNAPIYLDNPVCSEQFNYTSAMMPAIASLANGTLVLAYVEYNLSANATSSTAVPNCQGVFQYPSPLPCVFTDARLVVTESYTNGSTWTTPQVIVASQNLSVNASGTSWIPILPTISATGNTVYLAWSNFTNASFGAYFYFGFTLPPSDVGLDLAVSTNGGATWGSPIRLPTILGSYANTVTTVAYAPAIAIAPNGTLYVAYATNFTADNNYLCNPYGACGFLFINQSMDVVVAQSANNGSTFSISTAAAAVPVDFNGATWTSYYPNSIVAPAPSIAVDPATGQLYVAYAGGEIGNLCYGVGFCYSGEYYENVWLATSTNNGGSWTNASVGDQALSLASGGNNSEWLMTPSVGVGVNGTVYVDAVFDNGTVCIPFAGCDLWTDLLFESTDHGATFSPPGQVAPNLASLDQYPFWDGMTTSMAMRGGVPWFAWTQEINPTPTSLFCYGPSSTCYSQLVVSTLFTGTGLTATFNETGLPASYNWSLSLNGNARAGAAGVNLDVSGVPLGENLSWTIPAENSTTSWGVRYIPVSAPAPPYVLTANTTIHVTFVEEVLLNLTAIPSTRPPYPFSCADPFYGGYGFDCALENVTPTVGVSYVPIGTPFSYGVMPLTGFPFCYQCLNLSFLAWTGVGNGSWNTTVSNGTTTIYGPVNETVSFALLGFCSYGVCSNVSYNYTFAENGLPVGTSWTVTFGNQTQTSSTPFLGFNGSGGPIAFSIWVVPFNATYEYVGTPSVPSPITALQGASEVVTFVLEPIALGDSALSVSANGLPAGVPTWGFDLAGTLRATPSTGAVYTVPNGPVTLNATPVYGPNGTGAYPTGFLVTPQIVGAASTSVALGGTYNVSAPAAVTANYAPEYWLSVANSSGGSTTGPAGQWVHAGATVNLTATADPGFAFAGWSGTGSGSVTSSSPTISVRPSGPVAELATFVSVAPTFSLSVSATGVLAGVPITVSVGLANYTAVAPFNITGLTGGSYSLAIPTVYPNGTAGERFVTTGVTSSLPLSAGSIDVTADGTLAIAYAEQVTLTVGAASNGTTTPAAGTYWETAGTPTPLTATPDAGFVFVSWNGTGLGAVTSGSAAINVSATGPVTETPVFAQHIVSVPTTFTLTVTETGLPSAMTWSVSIGSNGASGAGALAISGLNGTYTVVVPTVLGATGVRYVAGNSGNYTATVTANASLAVTFTTQYALTVLVSSGGTATPSSEWVVSGGSVSLSASANASYQFVNWTGTGTGSYTGTSPTDTLTVSGPIAEFATFVPAGSSAAPSASGAAAWILPIGLLVVLLIVGLVVGLLLGRSRRPPAVPTDSETVTESTESSEVPVWSEGSTAPSGPAVAPPPDDEGGDTIYGGGSG